MPLIQIDGPPIDIEKKRRLVKELTDVAVKIYEIEHITVLIRENPPENVGANGELIADKHREE
ncbi:MAG: 4-oxalocrotonate tautomerase [Candidatus Stahlbacteria bacterium]|nr:MAG: 4-oxalocrotonate tautomerase [Candidatus Stahlbacteria bacterium]